MLRSIDRYINIYRIACVSRYMFVWIVTAKRLVILLERQKVLLDSV